MWCLSVTFFCRLLAHPTDEQIPLELESVVVENYTSNYNDDDYFGCFAVGQRDETLRFSRSFL